MCQVKTLADQRVYLDEAKELLALISNKGIQVVSAPRSYTRPVSCNGRKKVEIAATNSRQKTV